jgi:hypothetical protein
MNKSNLREEELMKGIAKTILIILIILVGLISIGCDGYFFPDYPDIEVIGEWLAEGVNQYGDWKQKLVITNAKITNHWMQSEDGDFSDAEWEIFWEAKIYDYDNNIFNGGEFGSGDHGYMVIKYTIPSQYHPESDGKYMVLRWQNLTVFSNETTMEWTEGFKIQPETEIGDCGVEGAYCGVYFDSMIDAKEQALDEEGFFGWFSEVIKQ